ncbi:hypothetical protein [Streptomyces chartreusis]|uniref:hypothetical protein n=1 Tax=Streptomyces chartreusis TaxID=1969 RepID=UPI00365B979C
MTTTYTAAWVPDDNPERGWDEAAELAVAWLLEQSRNLNLQPVLVTPTKQQRHSGPAVIRSFAQTYEATTSRSRGAQFRQRPVLAYVPDYGDMELATSYAHNSVLAVVESRTHPLLGWAMETQAVDLTTGSPTADTRSPEQRRELESIHDYGNNGWTKGFGADMSAAVLSDLLRQDGIDKDVIVGYMVARGHDQHSIARLAKIIDSAC